MKNTKKTLKIKKSGQNPKNMQVYQCALPNG